MFHKLDAEVPSKTGKWRFHISNVVESNPKGISNEKGFSSSGANEGVEREDESSAYNVLKKDSVPFEHRSSGSGRKSMDDDAGFIGDMFSALKGSGSRRASGNCVSGLECGPRIGEQEGGILGGAHVTPKVAAVGVWSGCECEKNKRNTRNTTYNIKVPERSTQICGRVGS